jgi:adenosine kinase
MRIVVTGSIAYDYLMTFPGYFREHILPDRLQCISLSFLVDSMVRHRGGTGANIAYNLALLGDHPLLLGTAGEDFDEFRAWLESKGVDTSGVRIIQGKYSASFFANTDLDNAQIATFYAGAMADAGKLSLHDLSFKPDLVVISPNDPGAMLRMATECQEMTIPYLYDPSQQVVRMPHQDIRRGVEGALALFVNEYEFELVQKHTGFSAQDIFSKVGFTVITCGEKGASIFSKGTEYAIPAVKPNQIADPTGVGDAFRGGFLTGYRLGLPLETCGRMGALAATYCLEQRGTQNHFYTPAEFIARYESIYGPTDQIHLLVTPPALNSSMEDS